MVKTLLSSLFAVFLFAMGAVGAWYFVQFQEKKAEEKLAAEQGLGDTETLNVSGLTDEPMSEDDATSTPGGRPSSFMPSPVKIQSLSKEEQWKIGLLGKEQIEEIKQREESLQEQEARLNLVRKDLDSQKMEIEGVLQQVKTYVAQGESIMSEIVKEKSALDIEKEARKKELEEIKEASTVPPETESKNLKKWAEVLAGMKADKAAPILKSLANDGSMNYALLLLDSIGQREASKILDALDDPGLQAEFTSGFRSLQRGQPPLRR